MLYEFEAKAKSFTTSSDSSATTISKREYGMHIVFSESATGDEILKALLNLPCESTCLSPGTGVVLDLQGRLVSADFLLRILSEFVWANGLNILSWISYNADTLSLLRAGGFATEDPSAWKNDPHLKFSKNFLLLTQSLRSGQRVEYPGDVMIFGNLNEGAEIYASGNVFVHGRLKGLVHAGMNGGECNVSAGCFEAAQVRLGDKYCSSLGNDPRWQGKSIVITLEDDSLVARELKI